MGKRLQLKSLFELRFISDLALTTDGRLAAAVHTRIEPADGQDKPPRYRGQVFLYDLESNSERAFTAAEHSASSPRFSPTGTQLAFLSQRNEDDKPQLYLMPVDGGEARPVTSFKSGVTEFAWHPDGERIALVSRGDWTDEGRAQGRPRFIDRMSYKRDGVGFIPDAVAQIYLLDCADGASRQISRLEADPAGLVFSPDGEALYFAAPRNRQQADEWISNLWQLRLGRKRARALCKNMRMIQAPSVSPDGTRLAFVAPCEPDNFASPGGLWTVSTRGGRASLLTGDQEVIPAVAGDARHGAYPNTPAWSEDGRHLIVNLNRRGRSSLAKVAADTGELPGTGFEEACTTGFRYAAGRLVFTRETPRRPGELFVSDGGAEQQLSNVNRAFLDRYDLARTPEERTVEVAGGVELPYWVLEPLRARRDRALVLQVHGGPHTNYGYGFLFEFQILAAAGYAVVFGNPRGGSSYGREFALCIQGRYGTIDAGDVLAIARDARQRHRPATAPMHLTGGSYGGFMTNWLVANTDEFASAVTQRSICNWLSFYGTSDIGYNFAEREQGGTPWRDMESLWQQSPLKHVENVTSPTLIIHSEQDHRCPIEQAEQWFIALKRIGKAPTRLIRFPDEGHELSRSGRPDRRVARLEAILEWFQSHP